MNKSNRPASGTVIMAVILVILLGAGAFTLGMKIREAQREKEKTTADSTETPVEIIGTEESPSAPELPGTSEAEPADSEENEESAAVEESSEEEAAEETAGEAAAEEAAEEEPAAEEAALNENSEEYHWRHGYYDFLMANYTGEEYPPTFGLFDITGDEIPELAVGFNGTDRLAQVSLYEYTDGEVISLGQIGSFSSFSYLPGQNRIRNDLPEAAFSGHILVQEIVHEELITEYEFVIDGGTDYSMGTPGNLKACTEEELNAKVAELFPENEVKTTPNVMFDENIHVCTPEEIQLIVDDPEAVMY